MSQTASAATQTESVQEFAARARKWLAENMPCWLTVLFLLVRNMRFSQSSERVSVLNITSIIIDPMYHQ